MQDRLGNGWTKVEILTWIQGKFRLTNKYTIKGLVRVVNGVEVFCAMRHPENRDRGEEAGVEDKCRSVEMFSIRLEWRSRPWLVMHADPDLDHMLLLLHWGSPTPHLDHVIFCALL